MCYVYLNNFKTKRCIRPVTITRLFLNGFNADLIIPFHNLISNHFVLNLYFNFSFEFFSIYKFIISCTLFFDYLVVKELFSGLKQISL